jgi:hypothetical protein
MIKKKIKFKKKMTVPKIPRFSKYIQRVIEKDLIKARKPDFYIATLPNSIPVIILKPKTKKAVAPPTSSNRRVSAETYIIAPRKLKNKIKAGINPEKLLRIIMNTQVKEITIRDLIINYPYVYRTFFEKTIPESRKEKKDSAIINRTSINARAVSFRENPVTFRTLPRVTITLNDSVKLRGLINLGAEINCIDKITYKQLTDMIIIPSLNIEMISHSNHRVSFIRVCKNIRLAIRPIKYEIYLFIIDVKTSHSLMLGIPFIFQFDLSLGTEENTGRQFSTVKDIDRRFIARFYTGPSNNAGRRRVKINAFNSLNL